METLGQAIKKARIDLRMPQKTLRERVGVSQKQLSAIELDKADPRWSTVVNIARALRVSLDALAHNLPGCNRAGDTPERDNGGPRRT